MLKNLLNIDPEKRFSSEQALAHEWFKPPPQKKRLFSMQLKENKEIIIFQPGFFNFGKKPSNTRNNLENMTKSEYKLPNFDDMDSDSFKNEKEVDLCIMDNHEKSPTKKKMYKKMKSSEYN